MKDIKMCPTCGSNKIRKVRRDVTRQQGGRPYTAPDVEFHECPECGEQVYSPEAVRKIQAHWPRLQKKSARRAS